MTLEWFFVILLICLYGIPVISVPVGIISTLIYYNTNEGLIKRIAKIVSVTCLIISFIGGIVGLYFLYNYSCF
jgi:hypothetical protein